MTPGADDIVFSVAGSTINPNQLLMIYDDVTIRGARRSTSPSAARSSPRPVSTTAS
jgi:hypothetical protein